MKTSSSPCPTPLIYSIVFALLFSSGTYAQYFQLGGGHTATDTNSDGTVVVGDNGAQHFMWTEAAGVTLIGGVGPQGYGGQTSISGDGTLIAGTRVNPNNNLGELSSYDVATQVWTSHGSLGSSSGNSASSAWGISTDGATIVGLGWINAGSAHGIQYTSAGGIVDLGSTVPGSSSRANTANSDGTIIGGWQDATSGFRQGAIWTNGVQSVITHPNGDRATEVGALSADGIWAGGGQGFGNNFQAWKWSDATGIIDIGPAPTGGWRGALSGLTSDGETAVGFYRPWPAPATFGRGFIHTDAAGMTDLTDYATGLGINVQGDILALPLGISDDGTTVVGLTDSGGGFVLRLPNVPSNNSCAGAIPLECGDIVTGNTENATDSGGNAAPDVFYSYSDTSGNYLALYLCNNTNFDTVLRVYSDCTLTTELASNDDDCGQQSYLEFDYNPGQPIYIMVEGAETEAGDFSLQVDCLIIGVDENPFVNFSYHPNPVDDTLFLTNADEISNVQLYSISGQLLLDTAPQAQNVMIDTASLSSGIYMVKVMSGGATRTFKIIK